MNEPSVLVVARDAGPAAALAPVVAALPRAEVVAWGKAAATFADEHVAVRSFLEDPSPQELEELLASTRAAVLLSGTSLRVDLDSRFWRAAERVGIPSVALLDHWKLYAERFSLERPFDALPTAIAVMDEAAAHEMVARGCPPDILSITGQPRFDALAGLPVDQLRAETRERLGIEPGRRVVVFASEPRGRPYDDGTGFSEGDALAALFDGVAAAAGDALVVVKLHPVERAAPPAPPPGLDVEVLPDFPVRSLAAAADVFCGITSIALLDAALLGIPTVSIRPGGGPDHFVDAHAGLIATASTSEEVVGALAEGFAAARREPQPRADATARVCALVAKLAPPAGIMAR